MRLPGKLLSIAGSIVLLAIVVPTASAADLGSQASASDRAPVTLRDALSRYLSLEMVRATFDVISRDDLDGALKDELARWGGAAPSSAELADIDQQLLAEASYYIVSLSYLVQVGGAVFPGDKAEAVYANDTISRLEDLRRQLFEDVAAGTSVLPVLSEVERIRALTEGYASMPEGYGVFEQHEQLLDGVIESKLKGTPT